MVSSPRIKQSYEQGLQRNDWYFSRKTYIGRLILALGFDLAIHDHAVAHSFPGNCWILNTDYYKDK